jgi:hypothetical protein
MPRKARIDTPGALHHIIAKGIEQRKIFQPGKQPVKVNQDVFSVTERLESWGLQWRI